METKLPNGKITIRRNTKSTKIINKKEVIDKSQKFLTEFTTPIRSEIKIADKFCEAPSIVNTLDKNESKHVENNVNLNMITKTKDLGSKTICENQNKGKSKYYGKESHHINEPKNQIVDYKIFDTNVKVLDTSIVKNNKKNLLDSKLTNKSIIDYSREPVEGKNLVKSITEFKMVKTKVIQSKIDENKLSNKFDKNEKSLVSSSFSEEILTKKQTSIKDHFPVRRSSRICSSFIKNIENTMLIEMVLNNDEMNFEVKLTQNKGRGVFNLKFIKKDQFVMEYAGELIDYNQAIKREEEYSSKMEPDQPICSYMYFFTHKSRKLCIDATAETSKMGRLINHSRKKANLLTRLVESDEFKNVKLLLFAKRNIFPGEELLYDYGDRSKVSLALCPWLND